MFTKARSFFTPTDGTGTVISYDENSIKPLRRKRMMAKIKFWTFWILVVLALAYVFISVLNGDISLFRTATIVVMAIFGAVGVYLAYSSKRNFTGAAMVNAIAVTCYAVGTLWMIPLLFQHSDMFRHAMASVTGHSSFDGSVGIVGHTPWYLMLFSLGFVAFLVYGMMVIAILATLSALVYAGDEKFVGDQPKKPKTQRFNPKKSEDETQEQYDDRALSEDKAYRKSLRQARSSYRKEIVMWRYRKLVTTGLAPIWLSLIAVVCSMLYISESYFNAIF